jgi:hypothetical protein
MADPNVRPVIATAPDTATDVANRENRLIRFLSSGAAPLALPVRSSTDGAVGYRSQQECLPSDHRRNLNPTCQRCGTSMSENSTRTPPVDSRAIASKNAPASGVVTASLAEE